MRIPSEHKRMYLALGLLALSFLAVEELRYGRVLGLARVPCEFFGGKYASAQARCVTRACYWFDDCGYWAAPSRWRDRIVFGDSIATVMFWLGQPNGVQDDTYSWSYGKGGSGRLFTATFRDGRFVAWKDDATGIGMQKQ